MACSNPKHTIHGNRTIQPSVPLKCFPTGGCSLCQGWTTETPGWCFGIVFPCPIVDLVCILCRGCCCKKSDSLGITACTFVPFCTTCLPILVRSTRSFQDQLALPHNLPAGSTCGSGSTRDAQAFFFSCPDLLAAADGNHWKQLRGWSDVIFGPTSGQPQVELRWYCWAMLNQNNLFVSPAMSSYLVWFRIPALPSCQAEYVQRHLLRRIWLAWT